MKKKLAYIRECRKWVNKNIGWYGWWKRTYCFIWLCFHPEWKDTRQKYKRMKKDMRRRFACIQSSKYSGMTSI